jgi:hypothetical protein
MKSSPKIFKIMHDDRDWLPVFLYTCFLKDHDIVIDFNPEGECHRYGGTYKLLDEFCVRTGYDAGRITIRTGNMLEYHDKYNIERVSKFWYEVGRIQDWVKGKSLTSGTMPTKHFGHFVGRSQWPRLWMAGILDSKYSNITLQTFHSGLGSNYVIKKESKITDPLGFDDLIKYNCNSLVEVSKFLNTCPRTIPGDLEFVKTCRQEVIGQTDYYPIQHPANLNITQYYPHIFVDIVNESQFAGNCFFVTEKTWRCIVARRPFIIFSNTGFLKNLKRLGFRTFDKFWPEVYDEAGMQHRIKEIELLLTSLSAYDQDQLTNLLKEMKDILDHNYDTFCSLTYGKIREVFQ